MEWHSRFSLNRTKAVLILSVLTLLKHMIGSYWLNIGFGGGGSFDEKSKTKTRKFCTIKNPKRDLIFRTK